MAEDRVANLLLRVTSDVDEPERDLASLGRQLSLLDQEEATPEVSLSGDEKFRRTVEDLESQLSDLGDEKVSPEVELSEADKFRADVLNLQNRLRDLSNQIADPSVELDTAQAKAELKVLQAQLSAMTARAIRVDVDVDPNRRGLASLMEMSDAAGGLFKSFSKVTDVAGGGGGGGGGVRAAIGGLSFASSPATAAILVLASAILGSLVAALSALIASLTLAVAGLAALGIAAGGALVATFATIAGAAAFFASEMDNVGSQANLLKQAVKDLQPVLKETFGPGFNAIFNAIRNSIPGLVPLIQSLRRPFLEIGRAVGESVHQVSEALVELGPEFRRFLRSLPPLIAAATNLFGPLLGVLLDIGTRAMPYLIRGIERFGDWVISIRGVTSDSQRLNGILGVLMSHLNSWLRLTKSLGDLFLSFVSKAAGDGQELVDWLTQGVQALTDWVNSAEGTEKISQFFEDVLPLAQSVIITVGKLTLLFIQFVQLVSPALNVVFTAFNKVLGVIIKAVDAMMPFIQLAITAAGALGNPFAGALRKLGDLISPLISGLGDLGEIFNSVGSIASTVANGISSAWGKASSTLSGLWNDLKGVASSVFNSISSAISSATNSVVSALSSAWGGMKTGLISTWGAISTSATTAWNGIKNTVSTGIRGALDSITSLVSNFRNAGSSVFNAVKSGISSVTSPMVSAARGVMVDAKDAVTGLTENFRNAGSSVFNAVRSGISSVGSSVTSTARSALVNAKDAITGLTDNFRNAGEAVLNAVKSGISSVGGIVGTVREKINDAEAAIRGLVGSFTSAGSALIQGLINGITSKLESAYSAVKNGVSKIRNLLPGSEPKDKSSPLRGLPKAGAAIMTNLASGVPAGTAKLVSEMRAQLASVPPAVSVSPVVKLAPTASPVTAPGVTTVHRNYYLMGSGQSEQYDAVRLDDLMRNEGAFR